MSGVYIKNIEMPDNCEHCPFMDYEEGFCFASGKKNIYGWYTDFAYVGEDHNRRKRDERCPLVLVSKHGRLIDADDVNNHIVGSVDLRDCPTIIPADKEAKE